MTLINKTNQDLTFIHAGISITLEPMIITQVDDSFADLPILSIYREKGLIAISGDKTDSQDNVKEVKKEVEAKSNLVIEDLPPRVKEDISKFGISVTKDMSEEALIGLLKNGKSEHEALLKKAKEVGAKAHHKNKISTLKANIEEAEKKK